MTTATIVDVGTLRVRRISAGKAWDRFVYAAPDASAVHLAAWQAVMGTALGHETVYLAATDGNDNVVGALPLVWVRSRVFGRYLVSMPFLNNGGPIGSDDVRAALAREAVAEARAGGADLLELRGRSACPPLAESQRKITATLALAPTTDETWHAFSAKLRSQVRRAQRAGFTTRSGVGELGAFYDVYAHHMRDLGSPALGRGFFEELAHVMPAHARFYTVYSGERPVAAGCGLSWRDTFELVWAASRRDAARDAPNMLLYWSCIADSIRWGHHVFDFGRCTPGSGTHRFKQQWGARDVPLPWATWSSSGVAAPPTPDKPGYRLAVRIWQRLPRVVTRACGPPLARLIP